MKPHGLYHFRDVANFGDALNPLLMEQAGISVCWSDVTACELMVIGSTLEEVFSLLPWFMRKPVESSAPLLHVFGSGFLLSCADRMQPKYSRYRGVGVPRPIAAVLRSVRHRERPKRQIRFHAVRGQLTRNRLAQLGYDTSTIALGDPALLYPVLFPCAQVDKTFSLGIVPHYADQGLAVWKTMKEAAPHSTIIDVREPPTAVVSKIQACSAIVSSSLHGLVLADSLRIPNRWVRGSEHLVGGDYKFRDYYSALDMECPDPIKHRDVDVSAIEESYSVDRGQIDAAQQCLLQALRTLTRDLVSSGD